MSRLPRLHFLLAVPEDTTGALFRRGRCWGPLFQACLLVALLPALCLAEAPADAELPAGMTLDWDSLTVTHLNPKRAEARLEGVWRFVPAMDEASAPPQTGWGFIKVPGSWQPSRNRSALVAPGRGTVWEQFDGAKVARAWYERRITVPADWQGRAISLRFDRVSTDAIVYVNGTECGRVAWPWGAVDVTRAVTPGQSAEIRVLVAAIADAEQVGTFWQNAFANVSYTASSLKSRGLTGNVFLESRASEARVTDVFVRTSTRRKEVALDVELTGVKQAGPIQVTAEMLNERGEVEKRFTAQAQAHAAPTQAVTVAWPWVDPRLWEIAAGGSGGRPNLYTLRLSVTGAGVDDTCNQPFGFREFWVEGREFYLNGRIVHLRQPCFHNGPRGAVGDNFSEMGDTNVDSRGDTADSARSLEQADREGYLVAQYVLNANNYILNSKGRFTWQDSRARALERAAVWMRHYRNHPSAVMWIAGFNFFNSAGDADPRRIGRRGSTDQSDPRWRNLLAAGRDLFEGLKALDSTRVYYSHAGADTGDVYTMNCYLDLLPLQEREEWLSAWADQGEMPISMVEFGTPMDCTYRRGHHGFESNITSEPLLTEYAAIYFGADAYAAEEPKYREFLHGLFRSGMLYGSSENRLDEYANNHKIQQLFRVNTWRSWRTAGLPGGLRTWSWMQDALKEINGPTLAWIAGPSGAYTAKDHHFASGQSFEKQLVLINDTRETQNFTATWTSTVAGQEAGRGEVHGTLTVSEIRFIPVRVTAPSVEGGRDADGQITLAARIGETQHEDAFAFRVFDELKSSGGPVAVVDPEGLTSRMLSGLGYAIRPWDGGPAGLVIVGRHALARDPDVAGRLETFVRGGGRALVLAQDPDWITRALGWRVCPKVARRVFPVPSAAANSPLHGLTGGDLRDWTGESTLIEARPEYVGEYLRGNEREQPYAGWHWGNRGGVSSAAIEKPHRSGWRPLLECEFDLAYTPLMELDYGRGRMTLCTLDLEDHVAADPAARRVAQSVIDGTLRASLSPRLEKVAYLGDATGAAWLDGIGLSYERSSTLDAKAGLVLVGADAEIDSAALTAYLERGGRAFFLPRAQADTWLGGRLRLASTNFAGTLSVPAWPEARGLSASDLRWRSYPDAPPWILEDGMEIAAAGLIGRKSVGKGVAVFCQIDPDAFQADEKTYFRYTRWRATRAVAQLLANLGASFPADSRVFHPLNTWSLNLDGAWQMQITRTLAPAASEAAAHSDPGLSAEAQALVEATATWQEWTPVTLPQMLPVFEKNDGEAVFRKEIIIPVPHSGQDLLLRLGALTDFDTAFFNGVEIGHTDGRITQWRTAPREYMVPGSLVKAGRNVLAVRLFNRFGPGGFAGQPGRPVAPNGDRSGPQATGSRFGLEMSLGIKPIGVQTMEVYHPDYRTDFPMGDNPYRYYRW